MGTGKSLIDLEADVLGRHATIRDNPVDLLGEVRGIQRGAKQVDGEARPIRRRIMKLRGRAAPENKVEIARLMYLAEAYLETDQFELAERLVAEAEGRSDGRQHRPGAAA